MFLSFSFFLIHVADYLSNPIAARYYLWFRQPPIASTESRITGGGEKLRPRLILILRSLSTSESFRV